jgi:hypothetical protein
MRNLGFLYGACTVLLLAAGCSSYHTTDSSPGQPAIRSAAQLQNVILITIDGVRDREFFGKPVVHNPVKSKYVFEQMWTEHGHEIATWGDRSSGSTMTTGNRYQVSQPGYLTMLTGRDTGCANNDCPFTREETVFDGIQRAHGLSYNDIAVFSSWATIRKTVTASSKPFFVNCAITPVDDGTGDRIFEELNKKQANDVPSWGARSDRYTWAHAMHYHSKYRPRVLYISLNDSDEWGHKFRYDKYIKILRTYDKWLTSLFAKLDAMGEYGKNTTVLITTDHGRGRYLLDWGNHGPKVKGAEYVWAAARGAYVRAGAYASSERSFSLRDIRPTLEHLFNISSERSGSNSGQALPGIQQNKN